MPIGVCFLCYLLALPVEDLTSPVVGLGPERSGHLVLPMLQSAVPPGQLVVAERPVAVADLY